MFYKSVPPSNTRKLGDNVLPKLEKENLHEGPGFLGSFVSPSSVTVEKWVRQLHSFKTICLQRGRGTKPLT